MAMNWSPTDDHAARHASVKGSDMSTDYTADIRKDTSTIDDKAVAAIVKFCGIALRGADSQYVSVTDPAEVKRVVDGFCARSSVSTPRRRKPR